VTQIRIVLYNGDYVCVSTYPGTFIVSEALCPLRWTKRTMSVLHDLTTGIMRINSL